MAYMTKDGKGPYPCCADEYCGNQRNTKPINNCMRAGRPRPAAGKTTEQLEGEGWIGLYLKKDSLASCHVCDGVLMDVTPPELREPT